MKTNFSYIIILLVLVQIISCGKDDTPNNDPKIADKFVGNYKVIEHAQTLTASPYPTVDTIFTSKITKFDDSTIVFVDTIQTPRRIVYGGFSFSRTVKTSKRELWAVGYSQGQYSENFDTLRVRYLNGINAYYVYIVDQKWIRY